MPMLLEDLADETAASLRRAADRMAAEVRDVGEDGGPADPAARRTRAVASARQATRYAVSRLPEVESAWGAAVASLRDAPSVAAATALLRRMLGVFEGGRQLCQLSRDLWARAAALGVGADPTDDLDRAEARFIKFVREARGAIDHRERPWQPADPERYAREMQDIREGKAKFVPADEARRWFRAD